MLIIYPFSITYVLAGVLVLPFGLLLDLPWVTIPYALLAAEFIMVIAHLAFYLRVIGPTLPLSLLGIAYALNGVALWAGLARSILHASAKKPLPTLEGYTHLLNEDREGHDEDVNESVVVSDDMGEDLGAIGFGIATSVINVSTALIPMLLAGVENRVGYSGLEVVFVALASFGCLACIVLARTSKASDL